MRSQLSRRLPAGCKGRQIRGARPSFLGLAASALSGAVAVWYLVLIGQGTVGFAGAEVYVAVIALILFAQAGLAEVWAIRRSVPLLAAAMLLVTGVLALFSIGQPLILAGMLAACAAGMLQLRRRPLR